MFLYFCFTVLTNSAIKQIESYKDSDPNYTIRRQMEHEHGEAKQIDCLRRVYIISFLIFCFNQTLLNTKIVLNTV